MVLATKYSNSYVPNAKDTMIRTNTGGNGSKSMKLSLESSLKRLQTSYIDLFYVHHWDYTTTIPELMHSLNDLAVAGKVLYLGISDTPAWLVAKANEYARNNGLRQFTVYQGMWNAGMRDFERDIIPMCQDEGNGPVPVWRPGPGPVPDRGGLQGAGAAQPGSQVHSAVRARQEGLARPREGRPC
jgi:aryl-alcohol dehydrogenase-like predicted oxidoreductase